MPDPAPSDDPRGAPAAEADVLGGSARNRGTMDGLKDAPASGRTPAPPGDAPPGIDENQAGFVKDPDKRASP